VINTKIFANNFIRILDYCYICGGYTGCISVSFKDTDWKNALLNSDGSYGSYGSYTKPNYHDATGLYV